MTGRVEARLREIGIDVPGVAAPAGNYVPVTASGSVLFVAGQLPMERGKPQVVGKLGRELQVADGQRAARLCAINIIAQLRAALDGDLDRVKRVLRVGGFVNAAPDFTDHPEVINGASDLLVQVFGDAGKHARAAVGVSSLPRGVAVEIEATVEVA